MQEPYWEEKIDRFKRFWNSEPVARPLLGFDIESGNLVRRFPSLARLREQEYIKPEYLQPNDFLNDYEAFYKLCSSIPDDLIRGVSPINAIPWVEAMLGCPIRIAGDSIWAEERAASWDELESLKIREDDPWLSVYQDFLNALSNFAAGRFPVGQPIMRGITDLIAVLRGHVQALIDCMDEPERVKALAKICADALIRVGRKHFETAQPFYGGYFLEMFGFWAPRPILRLQEDESSIYSPQLYQTLTQDSDRRIASQFPSCLLHLHGSSLFLLKYFLEIEAIDVLQVSKDPSGMPVEDMLPYLKTIQDENRYLLLKGAFTEDDLRQIARTLAPDRLLIAVMTASVEEAKSRLPFLFGLWSG